MTTVQEIPLSTIDGEEASLGRPRRQGAARRERRLEVRPHAAVRGARGAVRAASARRASRCSASRPTTSAAQEPGTNEEIAEFCRPTYGVKFPMSRKISVVGDDQHPLYRELTAAIPRAEGDPDAFRERLRGLRHDADRGPRRAVELREVPRSAATARSSRRFAPAVTPDDPTIVAAIDEELAR